MMTSSGGGDVSHRTYGLMAPPAHVAAMQANLSVDERVALARKEGRRGREIGAAGPDLAMRQHVLHMIAQDAEIRVRQALAECLAQNADAAPEVVRALAGDEDLVSGPLLRLSDVLREDDLVAIINDSASLAKMEAIAQRRAVQPTVCMALIERGDESISCRLLRNPGANISELGFHRIVDRFPDAPDVHAGFVDRSVLPVTVIDRVVSLMSAKLQTRLVEHHKLTAATATKIAVGTRERAALGLTSGISDDAMVQLIEQLDEDGRLTVSLLLRGLCTANFNFIAHALATRTRRSAAYVGSRLTGVNPGDIDPLWQESGFEPSLLPLVKTALSVVANTQLEGAKWDVDYLRARIAQRLITCFDDKNAGLSDEDAEIVLHAASSGPHASKDFTDGGGDRQQQEPAAG